ncbi:hypothetical protein BG011_009509 [Mortierella polycephala]|uniref:Response regulatory domain-containing protein n=1 Tax=Mortierella polycephala TaxID=41804 RepID=A0A9P6PL68_9FUNG|nr:hypothetical protein BG011_009509 [Mortierella polycephala]
MLRDQIRRILKSVVCLEFDDVKSALESGVIRMTELCSVDGSEMSMDVDASEQHDSMDGDAMGQQDYTIQGKDNALRPEDMMRFDFILVDHVLDSEELDRIYPSPIVAFILLLAPTTETLRWILPPAIKRPQEPEEPPESGQIDIGGRGRIFKSSDIDFAPQELRGRVQRVSHETSAQQNNAAMASIAGGAAAAAAAAKHQRAEHKGASLRGRKPSELFKKRKSRRHITVTRPMPSSSSCIGAGVKNGTCDGGDNSTHKDCQNHGPQRMETTTFQACRLIKPVRRMKLLQITNNAVAHHLKYQGGDLDETSTVDLDSSGVQSALSGEDEDTTPRSSMSPTSSPSITADASVISATSKKRRREHGSPDSGFDQDHQRGPFKSSRPLPSSKVSSMSSSGGDETASRNSGRNIAVVGAQSGNMPKRARNNDTLTLLLSPKERQSCRGKNVLVAEDDFVSQKILEKQLSKLGMNVMIASNGEEAVNQWLSAGQGHYTIAIFDHHMPIMDGLAATKKLRALEAGMAQDQAEEGKAPIRIPIVGLSADIQQTTKESCIKGGMDEYMTKPLLTKGLALLIQRYCCN